MKITATHLEPKDDRLDLFDISPVSMWLEDYSELKALFDTWRSEGVRDLRAYLLEDPKRVARCSSCIRLLRVNARTLQLYGARSFDELAAKLDTVLRDDTYSAHIDELEQLWLGEGRFQSKTVNYTLDGRRLDLLLRGVVLPGHDQHWDRVLVVVEDITSLETARRQLTASEEYARGLFENAPVSLWVADYSSIRQLLSDLRLLGITDFRTFTEVHPEFIERCFHEKRILDVNHHTLTLLKAPSKLTLLQNLDEVFRDDMRYQFREQIIDLWEGVLFQKRELTAHALDGSVVHTHLQFWVAPGHEEKWDQVLLAFTDITARKKAESYLEYLGQHDVLSGLKNRAFFTDEIERLRRKKDQYPLTAIVLDMNNLKQINDESGHAAGDGMLRRCGEVISQAVEKPAHASRTGGDEFIILMPGADETTGLRMMDDIQKLIALNNQYHAAQPALSISMGMATCSSPDGLDDMLRRADLAMYEQKRAYRESAEGSSAAR